MKRTFAIGIVLLVLIALTGVASAATGGKATVSGDVNPQQILELTLTGGVNFGTMDIGTHDATGVTFNVWSEGYPLGYHISVADKLDANEFFDAPKPAGTAGRLTTIDHDIAHPYMPGVWVWTNHPLELPLHVLGGVGVPATDITLTGADQTLVSNGQDDYMYEPIFRQTITPDDKPAADYATWDENPAYMIIVTFTAVPN